MDNIMTDPFVSVILPVYNGSATLAAAMRSVLTQSFQDFELLILDDASSDNSQQVASQFSDNRIRIVSNQINSGLAYQLNQGIDLARGRYIARMDQDDLCFPERFARQIDFLERHPEIDLVGCRAIAFRGPKEIIGMMPFRSSHEAICAHPWNVFYLAHPTWMGRSEWFRHYRYRIPEVFLAEDQELLLRAYPKSRFACLDDVLLAYRKERFNLNKPLLARRSLLRAQLMHFIPRRQYSNAALALAITLVKIAVDCIAAIPGCEYAFFRRMSEPVSASVSNELQRLD
jgi:glycosyltransferase involved in cell wall biosynthesis